MYFCFKLYWIRSNCSRFRVSRIGNSLDQFWQPPIISSVGGSIKRCNQEMYLLTIQSKLYLHEVPIVPQIRLSLVTTHKKQTSRGPRPPSTLTWESTCDIFLTFCCEHFVTHPVTWQLSDVLSTMWIPLVATHQGRRNRFCLLAPIKRAPFAARTTRFPSEDQKYFCLLNTLCSVLQV